jgi:hypothetical protein
MTTALFAETGANILLAEKILAVVGGAVVGGLVVGLLAQLVTRAFTTQKLPRWPLLVVRLLGAVIGGWLVALWVLGGGGAGFGGTGGWGLGSGPGKGDGEKTTAIAKKDDRGEKAGGVAQTPPAETLRIEVLGKAALKKEDSDASRCYRIDTGDGAHLLTFAEIKQAVKKRRQNQPPLRRIEIVLYKDSPDRHVPLVNQLKTWAAEQDDGKMKVDVSQPDADAPVK